MLIWDISLSHFSRTAIVAGVVGGVEGSKHSSDSSSNSKGISNNAAAADAASSIDCKLPRLPPEAEIRGVSRSRADEADQ